MSENQRFQALVVALVGLDPERQRLFQTSAAFNATIRSLARMLPLWVDGIAAHSEEVEVWTEEQYRAVMHGAALQAMPEHLLKGLVGMGEDIGQ